MGRPAPRSARRTTRSIVSGLVVLACFAGPFRHDAQAADPLWVGDGPACTHADLQSAVDAAADRAPRRIEIRVTRGVESGDTLRIRGGDIRMTGGWKACGSFARAGRTTLSGAGVRRVVDVTDDAPTAGRRSARVEMRAMRIVDGLAAVGGGVRIGHGATVKLYDSEVVGNTASLRGGGVAVQGGSALEMAGRSRVVANAVQGGSVHAGGGIACLGPGEVYLGTGVEVGANLAVADSPRHPSRGGGIYFDDRCSLVLAGGVRIEHNRAVLGAGIYAGRRTRGALLIGGPDLDGVPRLKGNRLSDFGFGELAPMGGALFVGSGSRITFERMQVVDNGADDPMVRSLGGAFALGSRAEFVEIRNAVTSAATADSRCGAAATELRGNRAALGRFAYLAGDARLELDTSTAGGLDVVTSDRFDHPVSAESASSSPDPDRI